MVFSVEMAGSETLKCVKYVWKTVMLIGGEIKFEHIEYMSFPRTHAEQNVRVRCEAFC